MKQRQRAGLELEFGGLDHSTIVRRIVDAPVGIVGAGPVGLSLKGIPYGNSVRKRLHD